METATSVSRQSVSEAEYLRIIINRAIENRYSLAVWRLPNDRTSHLIMSKEQGYLSQESTLEELPAGFIFSPFDKTRERIFLKADFSFSFSDGTLNTPTNPLETTSGTWLQAELKNHTAVNSKYYHLNLELTEINRNDYQRLIARGVDEIQKGTFEKVVPSRTLLQPIPSDFDVVHAFQKLKEANPNTLVSFVSTPATGSWLGATPELLVSVENKNIFKTIALAATQPYREGMDVRTVAWTQKDIEEHALVERYIVNSFKKIRLREFEEHGPKTVTAGNVLHLKSEFQVDMDATNFPQLGSVMLQLLHPTSAVCGVPFEAAAEFLKKQEGYDRQYYSGYLGPVNFNNSTAIFVNLRCAQLLGDKAVLYAGAGVTIDSVPENEWAETEMKMNTLRNILGP